MNKLGPIIIIDDDADDLDIINSAFESSDIKNEMVLLNSGAEAMEYFSNSAVQPFLILSDINMPRISGMELRDKIFSDERLRKLCVPYIFFTTNGNEADVVRAYQQSAQGFFIKPNSIQKMRAVISAIINYWKFCSSPELEKVVSSQPLSADS